MKHPMPSGYRITTNFSLAHPGTDYAPPTAGQTDCPCYAPEKGTVVVAGVGTVEGNYVIMQGTDTGKFYYFGHFSQRKVVTGQSVGQGAVLGILGKTGTATGIHTHCEVRDARNSTFAGKHNPEQWFKEHNAGGDMYDGKTAEQWYKEANAWHVKAEQYQAAAADWEKKARDRLTTIAARDAEIVALKAQLTDEYVKITDLYIKK